MSAPIINHNLLCSPIEKQLHNSLPKALKNHIPENLTQRKGDFIEERENLIVIRNYLRKKAGITCPSGGQVKSNREDGRGGSLPEPGSVRDIERWLNRHGEVMKRTTISNILGIAENLAPELQRIMVKEKTHKLEDEDSEPKLPYALAVAISKIEDKKEQKAVFESAVNARTRTVDEKVSLVAKYKQAPEEIKEKVREGEIGIGDVDFEIRHAELLSGSVGGNIVEFEKGPADFVIEIRDAITKLSRYAHPKTLSYITVEQSKMIWLSWMCCKEFFDELEKKLSVAK